MAAAKRNAAGKRRASKSAHVDRARTIAQAMPLVHFPANARLSQWSSWGGLASGLVRGVSPKLGPFGELRNNHVFVYAGPACYFHDDCIGDAVIYFASGAESGRSGGATSFDSGSLEDSPPKLQPFRKDNAPEAKRWRFFEKYQVSLEGWREHFAIWLADSYDDPNRYMESGADRHAAGQPDRTTPRSLLQHNGTRGREKYDGDCGDRRAWTWEVRIESTLSFEHAELFHVPFDAIERVSNVIDDMKSVDGRKPRIRPLSSDADVSFETLYRESGSILRELVES